MATMLAGGRRIEVTWHGPGPDLAPTLVFLHDGIGCAATWRDFPAALARETGCGALVYSRAGYGGSDPVALPRPLTHMHDEGFFALPDLLDAAGIRQAVLVGHSDGGSIALLHASTPRSLPRVRGLLLEAPHVFCEEISVRAIGKARDEYLRTGLRAKLERYHGGNVDCAFWGWNRAWLDPGFLAWNIEDRLPVITVPVLVVQGTDDPYGTIRQVEAIERGCGGPVRRCILEGCGHTPHREQRERTLSTMAAFVRGMEKRQRRMAPNPALPKALPRAFYDRDTVAVARDLLGKHLIHVSRGVERIGRIVEVEAYVGPHDLASHSSRGRTARTRVMFGPPGHAYVYLVYGMHCCMNVVTEHEGHASAVLVRAIEPVRNVEGSTRGPGRLCKAMHIDRRRNGHDLTSDDFYIADPPVSEPLSIVKRPRVGVGYAGHWARRLLRFYIRGNPFVSEP